MSMSLPPSSAGGVGPDPALGPAGVPVPEGTPAPGETPKGTSVWKDAFIRLRRNPAAIAGAVIVLAFVLVALLAPVLAPYGGEDLPGRTEITPTHIPGPGDNPAYPLGLDRFGGDVLSKLIWGAQASLLIGVISTALGLIGGMALGHRVLHQVFKLMVCVRGGVNRAAQVGVDGFRFGGDAQIQNEFFAFGGSR